MKYLLYRSFGNLEKDVKKHELVAVESVSYTHLRAHET